jgi:pyruvate/2-oxoacid:ferredoxin oxidoreductase alpha subunit
MLTRAFYDRLLGELDAAFAESGGLTRRRYGRIETYRTEDAAEVVVAMGTIADTATAIVDHLRGEGRPVGCVAIRSSRPFPAEALWDAIGGTQAIIPLPRHELAVLEVGL